MKQWQRTALHRHWARSAGVENTLTDAIWDEILDQANGRCHYYHADVGRQKLQIDHVIPMLKGGANASHNIVAACGPCNSSKSDKTLDEWQAMNSPAAQAHWQSLTPRQQAIYQQITLLLASLEDKDREVVERQLALDLAAIDERAARRQGNSMDTEWKIDIPPGTFDHLDTTPRSGICIGEYSIPIVVTDDVSPDTIEMRYVDAEGRLQRVRLINVGA